MRYVDRPPAGVPMRVLVLWFALGSLSLWLPVVHAGMLYRCTGSKGETAYSSTTAGYRACKKISTFVPKTPRASFKAASLARVTGSVESVVPSVAATTVESVSLAHIEAAVESSARLLGSAQVQHVSLLAVQGSVNVAAELPPAALPVTGTPGQWSYHESHDALAPLNLSDDNGNRVLRGSVYRIVRADGSVEYTNIRPPDDKRRRAVTMLFSYIETCMACNLHSPIRWGSVALNLTAYTDVIRAASVEYGVDEAFLRAIIHAESAFNPRAMSLKGAQGLMQLMPATANDMGVLDAFDTGQNIRGGARYLSLLLHYFNGDERLAAAAYNAGPHAVQRYSGVPPYAETQVYVDRVGVLRKRYGLAVHPPLTVGNPG